MFTGIIRDIGHIVALEKSGDWLMTIETGALSLEKTEIGASIACNGICLTVIEKDITYGKSHQFKVQLSTETLSKTTAIHWQLGQKLNLEPALRFGDELGGHLLTGHIDGLAYLVERKPDGDSIRCVLEAPADFARFIAPKGSVALDGVSLTVNEVMGRNFGVNIIPHTQKQTTFGTMEIGTALNFEVDMIARYLERMLSTQGRQAAAC